MTSRSLAGAGELPRIPHLARARLEVGDLRLDVDRAFKRLEDEIDDISGSSGPIPTDVTAVQTGPTITAALGQTIRCDPTAQLQTVNLPAIDVASTGNVIEVKAVIGAVPGDPLPFNIRLLPNGANKIDGAADFTLTLQRGCVTLRSDGDSEWMIV